MMGMGGTVCSILPESVDHGPALAENNCKAAKNRISAVNVANRVVLELDAPNRSSATARTISPSSNSTSSSSKLLSCPVSSNILFLLAWVFTVGVVSYLGDHSDRSLTQNLEHNRLSNPANCEGRRVFVHNISEVYNHGFVRECATFKKGRDLCAYFENDGMGREFRFGAEQGGPSETGSWYNTWQFVLERYFHARFVNQYPCLTDHEELADAFFVPYYAGMDLSRRFTHRLPKSELYLELERWLRRRESWKRNQGRDHFMVLGRIATDFRRPGGDQAWGNDMLLQKAFKKMLVLTIERSTGLFREIATPLRHEIAIPYPTYFHASSNDELRSLVQDWLSLTSQRVALATMAAGQRQPSANKLRHRLMAQCGADPRCTLLRCVGNEASSNGSDQVRNVPSLPVKMAGTTLDVLCNDPPVLLSAMHQSVFCLQPPGDSPTRRSFFDALLTGCIPVIFQKEAAWSQYVDHLPPETDGASYSVFIPMAVASKSNVMDVLSEVDKSEIRQMQANIAKLVPHVLYARLNERGRHSQPEEATPDAFDIAVKTVLERINSHMKQQLQLQQHWQVAPFENHENSAR